MKRLLQRAINEPLWIIGALWPLAILTPYIPGLPRPSPGGLPWRQEIVIALLLATTCALIVRHSRSVRALAHNLRHNDLLILLPFGLFTLWTLISSLWAAYPYKSLYQALTWSTYFSFFLLMRSVVTRPRLLHASLYTLAAVTCILSLACALSFWAAPSNIPSSLNSFFRYFSGFGEMMAVVIPVYAALALRLRNRRRAFFCGATAVLAWMATIQAMERAPVIGIIAGLIVLAAGTLMLRKARPRSFARAGLLFAGFLLAVGLQLMPLPLTGNQNSGIQRLQSTTIDDANFKVRFLYWGIALEMLHERPLTGIGASNYEAAYADARARFSAPRLGDPRIAAHEEMLIRWPHSQYIQVLAELGIIGFTLFLWLCVALALVFWRAVRRSAQPLLALGAGGGMFAFALSSVTSVNSFQWLAGGLVFFFGAALVAQAVAAKHVSAAVEDAKGRSKAPVLTGLVWVRPAMVCLLLSALAMFYNAGARAMNALLEGTAESTANPIRAEQLYRAALTWDATDTTTHYNYGMMLYRAQRTKEAVPHLRFAVERGFNESSCYSYLAAAEAGAGDLSAAEKTLAYAVYVYPRSVFLRTRYAHALAEAGNVSEAEREYATAFRLNERQARGWQQLINFGVDAASDAARRNSRIAFPGELSPESGMWSVIAENKLRERAVALLGDASGSGSNDIIPSH